MTGSDRYPKRSHQVGCNAPEYNIRKMSKTLIQTPAQSGSSKSNEGPTARRGRSTSTAHPLDALRTPVFSPYGSPLPDVPEEGDEDEHAVEEQDDEREGETVPPVATAGEGGPTNKRRARSGAKHPAKPPVQR